MKKISLIILSLLSTITFAQNLNGFKSLNNEEFSNLSTNDNTIIIDVRTPPEYAAGHINGAINIDLKNPNFNSSIKKLNKSNTLLIYCRSGKRSKIAASKISKLGYKVYELDKGIIYWKKKLSK